MNAYEHLGDLLDDRVPPPPLPLCAVPLAEIHRRAGRRRVVAAVVAGVVTLLVMAGLGLTAAFLRG